MQGMEGVFGYDEGERGFLIVRGDIKGIFMDRFVVINIFSYLILREE